MSGIRDVHPRSGILIFVHPVSRIPDLGSRILDPRSNNIYKEEGIKVCCPTFFCCHKYDKIKI
jgi:hypothetical protein